MQNNWKDLKSSKTEVDIVSNTAVNASTTDNTAARTTNATPIIASTNKIHINYNSKNNNNNNNSNNNNNNNNNNTVQQTFKCYVHGSLIYTRKYCRKTYLKALKCYMHDSLFFTRKYGTL